MSTITLKLTDVGYHVMYPEQVRVIWHLSDTGSSPGGQVYSKRPESFTPDSYGNAVCTIADTESMTGDMFYTISLEYLDPDAGLSQLEAPDWKIRVPAGTFALPDILDTYTSPLITWVGETYPDPLTAFWLNPVTGDFYGLDR